MADPRNSDGRGAVVVGFDGSEQARLAAFWAAREAARRGCALLVVDVLRVPMPDLALTSTTVPLPEAMTEEAVRGHAEREPAAVAADCRALCAGLEVRTRLEQGHPADALSTLGRDADLLVGVDGSPTSERALGFAFDFAARHGRDLLAVHAWADLPVEAVAPIRAARSDLPQVQAEAEALVDRSVAGHREARPEVRVSRAVAFDGPGRALLEHARDADLLVVGSHGRGAVRRALLGSVSHAVLYHAPCSVAIVHRDTTTPRGGDA
ncbi:universal stress protein [Actinosynnema sp. NPDC023794]